LIKKANKNAQKGMGRGSNSVVKNKNDIPPKLAGFRANIALTASLKANYGSFLNVENNTKSNV